MEIKLVRIIHAKKGDGKYNYSKFRNVSSNFLIPLEVLYRYALPEGSLKSMDIGFEKEPEPGTKLDRAFIHFSTKLEETDGYLSKNEAFKISGL